MISLTKLNGDLIYINPDLLQYIENAPDTIATFSDGSKFMVKENPEIILEKIIDFRVRCNVANPKDRG